VIQNQSRQITDLVNQILLFASTRGGQLHYSLRPLEVSQLIGSVVANTAELVREGGFVLEQQVEPGLPPVLGDLTALSRCLQNLVLNAVKYSGESRWIALRARLVFASGGHGQEIQVSVQDRGLGIGPSDMPRIFEPFYRSPAIIAAQIHGTGLGLPLAKSIAEAMGGNLSVSSELGVGSIFTLHLPVAETDALQMAAATSESHAGAKK
jgi:signal transduction histidine kinase